jgi:hypothetical protein
MASMAWPSRSRSIDSFEFFRAVEYGSLFAIDFKCQRFISSWFIKFFNELFLVLNIRYGSSDC